MSAPEKLTDSPSLSTGQGEVNEGKYLSDASPRHKPWDVHRAEADEIQQAYAESRESRHWRYAERVEHCSRVLEFARDPPKKSGKQKYILKSAWFCRVRHCPV